jgi:hypothetical protein
VDPTGEFAYVAVALYLNRRLRSQAIHDLNAVIVVLGVIELRETISVILPSQPV